ncbi:MAG: hypothetical protein Q4G36_07880 [Paracoccus sp. (in: a-proteobacteria)]|nr:hypothetical protein [Paracoccus sp. (in: a-proteobacteria)]
MSRPTRLAILPALALASLFATASLAADPAALSAQPGQHAQAGDISGTQILMVEQAGCYFCRQWDEQIFPAYDHTPEGQAAPLLRVNLAGPYPDGLALARRPQFTPTFILLQDGVEQGRIEGYPGDNFFWPQIGAMLERAGVSFAASDKEQ